jgi:hypothetical protein
VVIAKAHKLLQYLILIFYESATILVQLENLLSFLGCGNCESAQIIAVFNTDLLWRGYKYVYKEKD